jgi:hypothetical protein
MIRTGHTDGRNGARNALATLPWLAAFVTAAAPAAWAHPVTVDASSADWFGVTVSTADVAQISRDAAAHAEYVWNDASNDTRPEVGDQPGLDLVQFRVTGDSQRLYFVALTRGSVATSGAGAPMLQIALRTDTTNAARPNAFVDGARTMVKSGAEWDALFKTRFATGAGPRVCDKSQHDVVCSAQASINASGVIEGSIPWTALGYPTAPLTPVRFSVALFKASAVDTALAVAANVSNAVDVVSDGGSPASVPNTAVSTPGGNLDYSFDVYFNRNGEPYAPLLISQVSYAQGPSKNWVALVNVSRSPLLLSDFKVGDAPRPNSSSGGMGTLPALTLPAGQSIVVCQDGDSFYTKYGFRAGAECHGADPWTADMGPCAAWGEQPGLLLDTNGDHVLVLDRANTVIDVVVWKHASWPGMASSPGANGQDVLQRGSLTNVTNNAGSDFGSTSSSTPGSVTGATLGVGAPVVDGSVQFALSPNPFRGTANLSIRLATAAPTLVSVRVFDVTGRLVRTLLRDQMLTPGVTLIHWEGDDEHGRPAPSGSYRFLVTTPQGRTNLCGVRIR